MNVILWIGGGGVIGWLASVIMKTDAQGLLLNIIAGVLGAFLAGVVLTPIFGTQNNFSLPALIVSFLGSITLLGIFNLFRRGRTTLL